jgi:hypothetical protein
MLFRENEYLQNVFGEIVKEVVENLIKTKIKDQIKTGDEKDFGDIDLTSGLWSLNRKVKDLFRVNMNNSPLANKLKLILQDSNLSDLGYDIDFSDEINCLTCIYNIFEFYEYEHDAYNIIDGCLTFDKKKIESMMILEKKNIIISILNKCVENFSIDQELKERAKIMIQNAAKYIRARFLIEEKEDIEAILKSLKFRLNNMIELEKNDVLDKSILDDTLPDDIDRSPISKVQITKNKSELVNIVRDMYNSISDYIKEPQFNTIAKSNNQTKEMDDQKQHQTISVPTDYSKQINYNRPSKSKKLRKRKSKSSKINHISS